MSSLPYRAALSGAEPTLLEGPKAEAFTFLVESSGTRRLPEEWARWVAKEGPETWAWMLARRGVFIDGNRTQVHYDLLRRALADAEREGVVWSRLLDELAHVSSHASSSRGTSWGQLLEQLERQGIADLPPSPEAQAEGLADWVASQPDPAAFQPLFRTFQAPALLAVVARHAHRLLPEQVEVLRKIVPDALSANSHLGMAARDQLARTALEEALKVASERGRLGYDTSRAFGMTAQERWKQLMQGAEPLSEALQMEMLDRLKSAGATLQEVSWNFYPILAGSPHLTPAALERLAREHGMSWEKAVLHPNMPDELRERLLLEVEPVRYTSAMRTEPIAAHLKRHHLQRYADTLQERPGFVEARAALLSHPLSTPAMWLQVLLPWNARERELVEAAAAHPEVRHLPEIRPLLLKSRGTPVLAELLQDASAEEFLSLFQALYRKNPYQAGQALKGARVPAGVVLPQEMLLFLLQSPDAEVRLAAMTAFGTSGSQGVSPPPTRRGGR